MSVQTEKITIAAHEEQLGHANSIYGLITCLFHQIIIGTYLIDSKSEGFKLALLTRRAGIVPDSATHMSLHSEELYKYKTAYDAVHACRHEGSHCRLDAHSKWLWRFIFIRSRVHSISWKQHTALCGPEYESNLWLSCCFCMTVPWLEWHFWRISSTGLLLVRQKNVSPLFRSLHADFFSLLHRWQYIRRMPSCSSPNHIMWRISSSNDIDDSSFLHLNVDIQHCLTLALCSHDWSGVSGRYHLLLVRPK